MTAPVWRTSSHSGDKGTCVQVAELGGEIGVRDSKLGDRSPVLAFTPDEWAAFTAGVRDGEFDTP